ncbi:unnamed protein product [Sympodiomycopsis kandeliae]
MSGSGHFRKSGQAPILDGPGATSPSLASGRQSTFASRDVSSSRPSSSRLNAPSKSQFVLPPAVRRSCRTSMASWEIPDGTDIEWKQWKFVHSEQSGHDDKRPDDRQAHLAQAIRKVSRCQSRLSAWRNAQIWQSDPKGKKPAKANDPLPDLLQQMSFAISIEDDARTDVDSNARGTCNGQMVQDKAAMDQMPTQSGPADHSTFSLRRSTVLWLFQLRAPDREPHQQPVDDSSSSQEKAPQSIPQKPTIARTPSAQTSPAGATPLRDDEDEDLWGGSDSSASPTKGENKIGASDSVYWSSMEQELTRNVQTSLDHLEQIVAAIAVSAKGFFPMAGIATQDPTHLTSGSQDVESGNNARPHILWQRAIERKMAEQLVLNRTLERFVSSSNSDQTLAVRDAQVPFWSDVNVAHSGFPTPVATRGRMLRPFLQLERDVLVLLPPSRSNRAASTPSHRFKKLLSASFSTAYAPATRQTHSGGVFTATLNLRTAPFGIADPNNASVILLPSAKPASVIQWDVDWTKDLGSRLESRSELLAVRIEIAQRLEQQTGMDKADLISCPWALVKEENDPGDGAEHSSERSSYFWPAVLCAARFVKDVAEDEFGETAGEPASQCVRAVVSRNSGFKMSRLPLGDLIAMATAAQGNEAHEEQSSDLTTDGVVAKEHRRTSPDANVLSSSHAEVKVVGDGDSGLASKDTISQGPSNTSKSRTPSEVGDDDLFGSDDDDTMTELKDIRRDDKPTDRPGNDDGMYGMITEDDFAFFDDEMAESNEGDMQDFRLSAHHQSSEALADVEANSTSPSAHNANSASKEGYAVAFGENAENLSSGASNSGIPTDPSSMPAFTPRSFTDSSPATGILDRTPRTPTSPYHEPAPPAGRFLGKHWDTSDTIGRLDSVIEGSMRLPIYSANDLSFDDATMEDVQYLMSPDASGMTTSDFEHGPWQHRRLRDLGDKYQSGKFAVPRGLAPGIAGGGRRLNRNGIVSGVSRHDGGHRSLDGLQTWESSDSRTPPSLHKLRLGPKPDDESSEVGTIDGSASVYSDDSEDEESSETDDSDEELADSQRWRKECLTLLGMTLATVNLSLDSDSHDGSDWLNTLSPSVPKMIHGEIETPELVSLRDAWAQRLLLNRGLRSVALSGTSDPACQDILEPCDLEDVLSAIDHLASNTSVGALLGEVPQSMEVLESPRVRVALQGGIVEVNSTALKFWDKLGLSPAGGRCAITICLLHLSEQSHAWVSMASRWLEQLSRVYEGMDLGSCNIIESIELEIGNASGLAQACLQFLASSDQNEDTLQSIYSRISPFLGPGRHVVIHAVGEPPTAPAFDAFMILERNLRRAGRQHLGTHGSNISVRATAWSSVVRSSLGNDKANSTLESIRRSLKEDALALHQSLTVPIEHKTSMQTHPSTAQEPEFVSFPDYTVVPYSLDGASHGNISFCLNTNASNSEAMSRTTFLHAAYHTGSAPGDLACVTLADENGQSLVMRSRRREKDLEAILRWIWKEVDSFVDQACVRWRIVLCKDQAMDAEETKVWSRISEDMMCHSRCLDVTLACRDPQFPFLLEVNPMRKDEHPPSSQDRQTMQDTQVLQTALYPQMIMTVQNRKEHTAPLMALRSSIVVSTRAGSFGGRVDGSGSKGHAWRSDLSSTTGVAVLHIMAVFQGRLSKNVAYGPVGATATPPNATSPSTVTATKSNAQRPNDIVSPNVNSQVKSDVLDVLIREITRSQHALRTVAGTLDPSGERSWPFAALDVVKPCLDLFAISVLPRQSPDDDPRTTLTPEEEEGEDVGSHRSGSEEGTRRKRVRAE